MFRAFVGANQGIVSCVWFICLVITCSVARSHFGTYGHAIDLFVIIVRDGAAARPLNLPNHSKQHMAVCGLSLHQRSTESRKTQEQNWQIGTLNPQGINEHFSFN